MEEFQDLLLACSRASEFDKARYKLFVRNLNGLEMDPVMLD